MPSHENHIARVIAESRTCLSPTEIADRLNAEFGKRKGSTIPYTAEEVEGRLKKMTNIYAKGDKYCLKPEDASQAAARIVREATGE